MSGHSAEEEELSYDAHDWSPQHVLAWIDGECPIASRLQHGPTSTGVEKMTPEQLAAWKKEAIDGERLFTLTEDDLERIGVSFTFALRLAYLTLCRLIGWVRS